MHRRKPTPYPLGYILNSQIHKRSILSFTHSKTRKWVTQYMYCYTEIFLKAGIGNYLLWLEYVIPTDRWVIMSFNLDLSTNQCKCTWWNWLSFQLFIYKIMLNLEKYWTRWSLPKNEHNTTQLPPHNRKQIRDCR